MNVPCEKQSLRGTRAIPGLRGRGRWVPGALRPASLCYMASTEQQETCLRNEVDSTWHTGQKAVSLPGPYVCTHNHTYMSTHTCTHLKWKKTWVFSERRWKDSCCLWVWKIIALWSGVAWHVRLYMCSLDEIGKGLWATELLNDKGFKSWKTNKQTWFDWIIKNPVIPSRQDLPTGNIPKEILIVHAGHYRESRRLPYEWNSMGKNWRNTFI